MQTSQGPRLLEYNCRLGDPETQPILMRLQTDLFELLMATVDDKLDELPDGFVKWDPRPAICVVMASQGYPGSFTKGKIVSGLAEAGKVPGVKVFHAGTKLVDDVVLTDGGRVLGVTALGDTLEAARKAAYEAVSKITFPGAFWRKDIAAKALTPKP
jgi:phosphoribosylamine--glycine ligase